MEKISESLPSFRRSVDSNEEIIYEPGDFRAAETIFDIDDGGPVLQVGSRQSGHQDTPSISKKIVLLHY